MKGLLLSGVIGGGPAEQAGLQKGDVIVEIAGQTIANIYDYTYALEVLKIGEPAKVVYLRNGERKETTLTPARAKVAARSRRSGRRHERDGAATGDCRRRVDYSGRTFPARGPFGDCSSSKLTRCPSRQRIEASLDGAAVEEILLSAVVANEPEPFVALNPFNRAARHPRLLPVATARCAPRVQRLDTYHYNTAAQHRCSRVPKLGHDWCLACTRSVRRRSYAR